MVVDSGNDASDDSLTVTDSFDVTGPQPASAAGSLTDIYPADPSADAADEAPDVIDPAA